MKNTTNFFDVSSVVVIGGSEKEGKIGNDLLKNLKIFPGKKVVVNPKGGNFEEIEFFKTIEEIPFIPDMAVFAVPAALVKTELKKCGEKGIKNAVIISAGFKESGNIKAENEIITLSEKYGINILGPNCLGFLDTHNNLNLSFAGGNPKKGNIALVSQSGAMAVALIDWATRSGITFSKIISMGNKSDLNECDFVEILANDPQTEVMVFYLESIENGKKFYENAKKISAKKPIILVNSGVSQAGSSAIASHTGSLASSREVAETAFMQAGIHFTHSLEDMFRWSKILSRINTDNIADELIIITNAGGPAVMATDNAEFCGIKLAQLSAEEKDILKYNLPPAGSVHNPIDILGDATSIRYRQIFENISKLEKKYNLLVMLTPQTTTDTENIAQEIISYQKQNPQKLIMTSFMGGESVLSARKKLIENGIFHYSFAKEGLKALAEVQKQKEWKKQPVIPDQQQSFSVPKTLDKIREKIKQEKTMCSPELMQEIFEAFDIPYASEQLAKTPEQAKSIFEKTGGNTVMKISSVDIPHKTDCGGVVLGVSSPTQAADTYKTIVSSVKKSHPNAKINGVTIQKMFSQSREVFIGAKRDPSFGDVLLFGFGGIYVNIFEDISRRMSPISTKDAHEMIKEIKAFPILQGVRGEKPIDFKALEKVLYRVSWLFHLIPEIKELDINPLFAQEDSAWVIDAKMFI